MPDKQLLRLLGEDKRYIYRAAAWMLTGSLSSIGFTACLCYGLHLLLIDARMSFYLLPFGLGAVCAAVLIMSLQKVTWLFMQGFSLVPQIWAALGPCIIAV